MILLDTIKEVIRDLSHPYEGRYRPCYLTSDRQVSNALEYAIGVAVGHKRDVWGKNLIMEAQDFKDAVCYYFRHMPDITTDYTDQYIVAIPVRAHHAPPAKRDTQDVRLYLRLEFN